MTKNVLATFWAIFFVNPSGRPARKTHLHQKWETAALRLFTVFGTWQPRCRLTATVEVRKFLKVRQFE
jgi:hypothetical protein